MFIVHNKPDYCNVQPLLKSFATLYKNFLLPFCSLTFFTKTIVTDLVKKWKGTLGVTSNAINARTTRTKWSSCNTENGNILLNIELIKKPIECIEYVVVHELLHLLERNHNERFRAYLDQNVPNWRSISETLQGKVL